METNDFPAVLRQLREAKGLTQAELGRVFNLSKQTISSYENGGSSPDRVVLRKMADYFGVSTDYLLGRTNRPQQPPPTPEEDPLVDPELRVLFRDLKSLDPEDRQLIADIVKRWRERRKQT